MAQLSISRRELTGAPPKHALVLGYKYALAVWRALRIRNPRILAHALGSFYPTDLLLSLTEDELAADTILKPLTLPPKLPGAIKKILAHTGLPGTVDLLVGKPSAKRNSTGASCHVWKGQLSCGLTANLDDGIVLCAPELVFAQMCGSLSLAASLELAHEFCGSYSMGDTPSMPYADGCQPLTSPERLRHVVSLCPGIKNAAVARQAARLVAAGSRSPMETQQSIILSAPRTVGGYGCGTPLLNHRIDLTPEASAMAGRGYLVLDAYFPQANTTVEYQGSTHNQSATRASDDARENALALMGINTVRIWPSMLYDETKMDTIAQLIYKRSGIRLRKESPQMLIRRGELFRELRESSLTALRGQGERMIKRI